MRSVPSRLVLIAAVALSLASCEKPAPPVVTPPPPPAPPAPVVHRPVASTWSFQTGDTCTATAGGGPLSMEIAVSRDTLDLTAHLPKASVVPVGNPAAIVFSGPSGTWSVAGRGAASHRVVASQPMTEDQAGQILVLLGGGGIKIGSHALGLPELRIPNGGVAGRDWFECVRAKVFP
jgi:hypothetical protein